MAWLKVVLIITIIFLAYRFLTGSVNRNLPSLTVNLGKKSFDLEIAKTSIQHTIGLSNRSSLCPNCGMIFIFSDSQIRSFWMKNTKIPLDMIFLDPQFNVVTIHTATVQPNTSDFALKQYTSSLPSKYVIEINANLSKSLNLNIGDKINLSLP